MSDLWHNWMGNLTCRPLRIWTPHTLDDRQDIVRRARVEKRRVRLFGSRHSWMPLVPTDDYLVDIDT